MKKNLRALIPNEVVNLFKHLPSAVLANIIHGFPSRGMKFIGVTGTDGKTTTTNMIYRILKDAGLKVAMVSTINAEINGERIDTGFHVTNPDYFLLQKLINRAKNAGTEIFVLEVTSHGLDQFRTWGINFEVGVITNITSEHLDYHKTWQNYFRSKSKLIKNANWAVLNREEDHFDLLKSLARGSVLTFGKTDKSDFNPEITKFKLKLPGEFNVLNALAAIAATSIFQVDTSSAVKTLENFSNLEGRMQEVENKLGIKIVIDFAHTANALENALKTLRNEGHGKLISVFGCAGLRDVKKRPLMGEISAILADITVITAEDPRGEIDEINKQILEGVKKGGGKIGENVYIENDRQKAIELAITKLARKGDTVGIFGKGHEKSNNIDGRVELPWSDQDAVRKVLNERHSKIN
jgi:UDP-N-acetylmuramoyl-L-alanyl-D-glutamate--2,6-diaminopimelate ligase